jgi:dipeptidyl-peptidase 9
VLGKNLWVDRHRNLVYFMGLAHSPLEKHLYVFNLQNPDKKRLLTTPGSTNTVEFNEVG